MIKTLQDYTNLIQKYLDKCYAYIVNHIWAKSSKMSPVSIDIWVDESINNRYIYDSLRMYCIMLIRCEKEPVEEVVIRIYEAYMDAPNLVRYNSK
jgi:hypothetical protein